MPKGDDFDTELSKALLQLRDATHPKIRQVDVVARTGISQAQLSRIEQGKALPSSDEVEALARLYGADEQRTAELVRLAKDLRAGVRDTRLVVQRGNTLAMQQRWRRIEGDATTVRAFNPALVLGVLQVPRYAAIATREPVDSPTVRDRMLRHQRLLTETSRRHLLIQTEGALRQTVGSPDVMAEQRDAILHAAAAPNVELGVIPAGHPLDLLVGSGFHLYDDTAVVIGLEIAAATLTDPADIAHFRHLWDRLRTAAVTGDEAAELIRSLPGST
jgi:transcriptional regulator with XRE-family HTH domain